MDKSQILRYANTVAQIGRATVTYQEGMVVLRLVLWTLEQLELEKAGNREKVTPEETKAKCDELIREVEGG